MRELCLRFFFKESLWLEDQKQDAKDDKKYLLRTDLDLKACTDFAIDPLSVTSVRWFAVLWCIKHVLGCFQGSDALLTPSVRDTIATEVALLAHNQSSNQVWNLHDASISIDSGCAL